MVLAVGVDVEGVLDEFVGHHLFEVVAGGAESGEAVDDVADEVVAVELVLHPHVEGGGDGSFFVVAADVQVAVGAAIGQPMHQPRITVKVEN